MHNRNGILWTVIFFVILTIALGCSYKSIKHGEEISEDRVSNIEEGKTTKSDVLMEFGEPTKTMDEEKVFFYSWTRGSKSSVFGFGGGEAYSKSLVIVFDEGGIVQKYKITRGATDSGATVGD